MSDASDRWARRAIYATIRAGTVAIGTAPSESDLPKLAADGKELREHITIEGSGFVADPRGLVVTAKHVLKDWIEDRAAAREYGTARAFKNPVVISQAAPPSAFAEGADATLADPDQWYTDSEDFMEHESLDLAVVLIPGMRGLPQGMQMFALAPAGEECQVGDEIIAAGFPLGMKLHRDTAPGPVCTPSITAGVVSAILPTAAGPRPRKAVQFDATILSGASGGPLCDAATGHVVGMTLETWDGIDPRFIGDRGRPIERFVAFPQAIPLFQLEEFVERARRRWEMILNPVTRLFMRATGGMGPMVGMTPDPNLPWLPAELQERFRRQEPGTETQPSDEPPPQ